MEAGTNAGTVEQVANQAQQIQQEQHKQVESEQKLEQGQEQEQKEELKQQQVKENEQEQTNKLLVLHPIPYRKHLLFGRVSFSRFSCFV